MKYILLFIGLILAISKAQAQGFTSTDSLRTYNIKYITNNAATAFTNLRLHTLLRGIIDWVDTARAGTGGGGAIGIDTLYALNDSTIRYRRNGVFRNTILRGVYDTRRKVDTAYTLNDSTLQIKINGTNRNIILPGRHWDLQGILNNGSTLTENETITLADSLRFTSGMVIIDTLNLPNLVTQSDTTANKPVVIDASGNVHKMVGWPVPPSIDTTNKWINNIRRRSGTDSVEIFKNGSWQFAYKDSTGGGGGTPAGSDREIQIKDGSAFGTETGVLITTDKTIVVDSVRTKMATINTDTLTGLVVDIGNTESNANVDSVGRFGFSQSETLWEGWPRKDVVFGFGYNDPQAISTYKANAGSFLFHMENDYFGQHELILQSITHSGFGNRHMFGHFNKYSGTSDFRWSISSGMQWFEYDSTSNPYLTAANNGIVAQGENATFTISNKNLHTGVNSGSFVIAPQGDGSVNLGTGNMNQTALFANQLNVSSTAQFPIITTLTNSNSGAVQISGSTTAASGYPTIINSEVSASGGTLWTNNNTHATGDVANILESDGSGNLITIYRSASNANDFNTGYSASNNDFRFTYGASVLLGGTNLMTIKSNQRIGLGGVTSPTARLHLPAGTAAANTAPLKIDAGTNLTTPESGAVEFDGTHFYGTVGSTRYQLDQQSIGGGGIYGGNGTLPSNVTVSTGGFTTTWSGSNDSETMLTVSNTGSTAASAINGTGGGNGTGVQGESSSGIGVAGISATGAAFRGQINPASTNTIENAVTILRTTSAGAGANGIGAAIQYELETATSGTSQIAGSTAFVWSDATNATRTSRFEIYGVNSATTARKAALAGNGQWTWDGYGSGTHTVTPATTPVVSSSGVVGERVAPKIYTALISQSGTSDPTVTVLGTNEIGSIVWTRSVTGTYVGTLTGAFTANKTWCASSVSDEGLSAAVVRLQRTNDNAVTLYTSDNAFLAQDVFTNISIEIRVYP